MPRRPQGPGFEFNFQAAMQLAQTDPIKAASDYRDHLLSSKKPNRATLQIINRIIAGDESAWHASASNLAEAVQFIIANGMLKGAGMGVINPSARLEGIIDTIGNIIAEDTNVISLTPEQRRLQIIAESYGYNVYILNEADMEDELDDEDYSSNDKIYDILVAGVKYDQVEASNQSEALSLAKQMHGTHATVRESDSVKDMPSLSASEMDEIVEKGRRLYNSGECGCWSEVYLKMEKDIEDLARSSGKSEAFIMASIIDDAIDLF